MKKAIYGKKFVYHDELSDDFAGTHIDTKKIPSDYCYLHKSVSFRFWSFLLYYCIALPILLLIGKIHFGIRVRGRKNIRCLKTGYFVYGNHTQAADSWIGHVFLCRPRRTYIIANPDAVSIPFVRHLTVALGALPLPSELKGYENFLHCLDTLMKEKKAVVIYPEAHIWPYYTGIREYPATSFIYPARFHVPAVPVVTTYRLPKGPFKDYRKPRLTIHIGKPLYPDMNLTDKENARVMCDASIAFMKRFAQDPDNVPYNHYVKEPLPESSQSQ